MKLTFVSGELLCIGRWLTETNVPVFATLLLSLCERTVKTPSFYFYWKLPVNASLCFNWEGGIELHRKSVCRF